MAMNLCFIKPEFKLDVGDDYDELEVKFFVGEDWRNPSHLAFIIGDDELWIIPMSDVEEGKFNGCEKGYDTEKCGYVYFIYKGNNEKFLAVARS